MGRHRAEQFADGSDVCAHFGADVGCVVGAAMSSSVGVQFLVCVHWAAG